MGGIDIGDKEIKDCKIYDGDGNVVMMFEPMEVSNKTEKVDINWTPNASLELNLENDDLAKGLLKQMGTDIPDKVNISMIKLVQARRHKKKRINKKWLKRYGYKEVQISSDGWKCEVNNDSSVEFTKHITEDEYYIFATE